MEAPKFEFHMCVDADDLHLQAAEESENKRGINVRFTTEIMWQKSSGELVLRPSQRE